MAGLLSPGTLTSRRQPAGTPLLLIPFLILIALLGAGCGEATRTADLSSPEKIGYIQQSAGGGQLLITGPEGGAGQSLLAWKGFGERFTFSGDGSFFTMGLGRPGLKDPARSHYLIAASDGSSARHFLGRVLVTFSPDSSKVAYVDLATNQLQVMELATGATKTLATGERPLVNPTWTDESNLVYTELEESPAVFTANRVGGVIYLVNIETGQSTALTPPGRAFSTYNSPVTWPQTRLAVVEKGELTNLWSLDIASRELRQITNNTLFQFRAGYLPGTDTILFEGLKNAEDLMSSELLVISDDGSDHIFLTNDFYFDGLHSFSTRSGKIVYQNWKDDGETSIWTVNPDGSEQTMIVRGSDWVGDPNFVPVSSWKAENPLQMTVTQAADGESLIINVKNASGQAVEARLRAFAGTDLSLVPAPDSRPAADPDPGQTVTDATAPNRTGPQLRWDIDLQPGESRQISVQPNTNDPSAAAMEAALLLTLAVPGTPPRMYWQDFAS